jgi:hypothetical protein
VTGEYSITDDQPCAVLDFDDPDFDVEHGFRLGHGWTQLVDRLNSEQ